MINEKKYKEELIRMWDSIRVTNKGSEFCSGLSCSECPLDQTGGCDYPINAIAMAEVVEKWSKEHQKKYKVSKMEYDILEINLKYIRKYHWKFNQARKLCDLLEKGYFEGATSETYINDYFDNCEVEEDDG